MHTHTPPPCSRLTVQRLVQEYQLSYDMAEAERCLRALAVPFFHHELVKQMLLSAIEGPQHSGALLGLLEKLAASGEVSESQTAQVRPGLHPLAELAGPIMDALEPIRSGAGSTEPASASGSCPYSAEAARHPQHRTAGSS